MLFWSLDIISASLSVTTGCANKNSSLEKRWYGFEPNVQTLYVSNRTTYLTNFIEIADMVRKIQQFKLFKVHFFK